MRRSVIAASAALALGGSLAVASTASAGSIPTGAPTDTSSASLNGLLNQANTGLITAENVIFGANELAAGGAGSPVDTSFTSAYTSASQLTATTVPKIAADFADSSKTGQLELAICVQIDQSQNSGDSTSTAVGKCQASNSPYMAAAVTQFKTSAPQVATAGASWAGLTSLVAVVNTDPTDFPGGLYTVDGDVSISSTATVTAIGKPVAYSATFGVSGAAATGFVLPQGFALTFPANFNINAALVADEIQGSQVANPPSANAIGTATVTSPEIAALVPGSKGVDSSAQVFAVATSSLTQPEFEVYLGQGYYILGTLTGVTFPLTVSFGLPYLNGTQLTTPLPVASVTMNFPAATSPLLATSCTDAGTLTGTMTDDAGVSALASTYFKDTADTGAQAMTATSTVVTNQCATATGFMRGLNNGKVRMRVKATTGIPFGTVKIGLPKGLRFVKASKKVLTREVAPRAKWVRIVHGKLVIALKHKTKVATITTKKGLIFETPALIKSIKRHKTKTLTVSLWAGNTALKISVKA